MGMHGMAGHGRRAGGWRALALAFAALCLPPGALCADRLELAELVASGGFRTVRCDTLLNIEAHETLAFALEVPAVYRPWESSLDVSGSVMWSRLLDWTRVRNGQRASGRYGAFVVQRSDALAWSALRGTFADSTGLTEANLHERLVEKGGRNVRVQRIDRGSLPVLLVEADLSELETLRALYIGTHRGTRKLYYLPQRPWSAADDLVWSRLRAGFAASSAATEP